MNKSLADHIDLIRLVRSQKKSDKAGRLIGLLIAQALLWPLGGWALMLLLGILHHEVSSAIPALGFWINLALVALASFVKSAVAPDFPENE